ncbi:MAG TPA: flagellar hook-basal body complex protein FliE [Halieaceae bacterium]|jgi:flagellar hook-basal body complex protein FliE|nr:flagellar hook-basal body complex protein FliE [Halieaceae bacterium]|tara:strand:- start:3944 stop:4255 length:312 start_codon:yes stop_codon:yes gene_type:complete
MSEMAINQVLAQMRSMAAEAGSESAAAAGGADFSSFMKQSIDDVNQAMQSSREMATAFEAGEPGVSLAELMVTAQKASLEFQALSEVRNKLLTAYREVMSMQV